MMGKRRLRGDSFAREFEENPMSAVANLVDIMLVFVCGLLVAIIMFWNVNLADVTMIIDSDQIEMLDDANQISVSSEYDDLGEAYVDPVSGEVIVVKDGE